MYVMSKCTHSKVLDQVGDQPLLSSASDQLIQRHSNIDTLPDIKGASIDQVPGPRTATTTHVIANMMAPRTWSVPETAIQSSVTATTAPAIGVHNPTRRKIPALAAITSRVSDSR